MRGLSVLCLGGALLIGEANAADYTIDQLSGDTWQPVDLLPIVKGEDVNITLPTGVKMTGCTGVTPQGPIKITTDSCAALYEGVRPSVQTFSNADNSQRLHVLVTAPMSAASATKDGVVTLPNPPSDGVTVYAYAPSEAKSLKTAWHALQVVKGRVDVSSLAKQWKEWADGTTIHIVGPSAGGATTIWHAKVPPEEVVACTSTPPEKGLLVVLSADDRSATIKRTVPEGVSILRPNTPVEVCVERQAGTTVTVTMNGTRGLEEPGVETRVEPARGSGEARTPAPAQPTSVRFAPRKPGSADIQVAFDNGPAKTVMELEIEKAVAGVVRAGFAVGNVVDTQYTVATAPGSDQPEVLESTYGTLAPELVIGFAPFLDTNGRTYLAGKPQRIAPYIALGVVEANLDTGVDLSLLKSLYLGAEFELMRSSSVAATAVMKRVDKLGAGYQVGGPATGADALVTRSGYSVGVALVFNVSPEFLEVARNGVGAKKKGE